MDVDDDLVLRLLRRDPQTLREEVAASEIDEARVRTLGKRFVSDSRYMDAIECFRWLSEDDSLRRVGRVAFDDEAYNAAQYALESIERQSTDDMALLESIAEQAESMDRVYSILDHNTDRIDTVQAAYLSWCNHYGFDDVHFPGRVIVGLAAMAKRLSEEFDVVIGVPRGGLLVSFMFDMFGCQVGLLEYHRDDGGDPVWIDRVAVDGEDVLVCDKDVRSGRTTTAIGDWLVAEGASSLAIALMWDEGGLGSRLDSLPELYQHVFVPADFEEFLAGFKSLERRL